jgi:hypothetical protein
MNATISLRRYTMPQGAMPLLTEAPLQQKDHLCGPFHAARILRDFGVTDSDGEPLDQDLVALRAGTTLPRDFADGGVPIGAASWSDYRFELARVDSDDAGTSARGLASAIEELATGRLVCVPISGQWTADAVEGLMALDARLIANLRTGRLWGACPRQEDLLAVLDGTAVPDAPPPDWDVGHFVELVELLRGRRGSLVLIRDSYPSLGWGGLHLQPPAVIAEALIRGDGRQGGVLAVVEPEAAAAVHRRASELGLKTEMWEN